MTFSFIHIFKGDGDHFRELDDGRVGAAPYAHVHIDDDIHI